MPEGSAAEADAGSGLAIGCRSVAEAQALQQRLVAEMASVAAFPALQFVLQRSAGGLALHCSLDAPSRAHWAPDNDTLGLGGRLGLPEPAVGSLPRERAIALETLAAMLVSPWLQRFPSPQEFEAALRLRVNTVRAARLTALSFDPRAIERPIDCWDYHAGRGFVLRPGVSIIEALRKATQPGVSRALYAFSCYRATEYVLLLALAQELHHSHPALFAQLEALWRRRAIASGEFHEVFLHECGSIDAPVPQRYYVPGDRVWFRNPDEASADASGFEGSWVIYEGGGLFSNFWKQGAAFSFDAKCLEIYHWRDAVYLDAEGETRIDETRVAELVARSRQDPGRVREILARMQRWRDPRGVYAEGGCIDSTREHLRCVLPGSATLALPVQ